MPLETIVPIQINQWSYSGSNKRDIDTSAVRNLGIHSYVLKFISINMERTYYLDFVKSSNTRSDNSESEQKVCKYEATKYAISQFKKVV